MSKVLSTWCYMMGIRYAETIYTQDKKDKNGKWIIKSKRKITQQVRDMWCKRAEYVDVNGKKRVTYLLSGNDTKMMIKDMLFMIKDKNPDKMYNLLKSGNLSMQLYNYLSERALTDKEKFIQQIAFIKDRLYYDFQANNKAWNTIKPIFNPDYLIGILNELDTSDFILDMGLPVVNDLYKYPLECKDTQVKPMSDEKHISNLGDYDMTQYVFERDN